MAHRLTLAGIKFIADFAAFCRTKGDEEYDYESNEECACAMFLIASGRAIAPCVGGNKWLEMSDEAWPEFTFPQEANTAAFNRNSGHTFSALADRLEALIVDAPAVETQP